MNPIKGWRAFLFLWKHNWEKFPKVVDGIGAVSLLVSCTLLPKQLPRGGCPVLACRERIWNILGTANDSLNLHTYRLLSQKAEYPFRHFHEFHCTSLVTHLRFPQLKEPSEGSEGTTSEEVITQPFCTVLKLISRNYFNISFKDPF